MEKRQHPRAPCDVPSRWHALETGREASAASTLVNDISEGGIRFRSNAFIPVRRRLRFKLELPDSRPLDAAVEPVWVREIPGVGQYEIGARFLTLSEADRNLIRDFISLARR